MGKDSSFLSGGSVNFREAFPTVRHVWAEATESDIFGWGQPQSRLYTESNLNETINCHTPRCDGGLRMGNLLRDMVSCRETQKTTTQTCRGHERLT